MGKNGLRQGQGSHRMVCSLQHNRTSMLPRVCQLLPEVFLEFPPHCSAFWLFVPWPHKVLQGAQVEIHHVTYLVAPRSQPSLHCEDRNSCCWIRAILSQLHGSPSKSFPCAFSHQQRQTVMWATDNCLQSKGPSKSGVIIFFPNAMNRWIKILTLKSFVIAPTCWDIACPPSGLYMPTNLWQKNIQWFYAAVAVDFITTLPSSHGCMVVVAVNKFSKTCKLILKGLPTAMETAKFLFHHIWPMAFCRSLGLISAWSPVTTRRPSWAT